MNRTALQTYFQVKTKIRQYGGQDNEGNIRSAFAGLLRAYAAPHNLELIEEYRYAVSGDRYIYVDGALKNHLRVDHGHWEAKDAHDDLEVEIEKKRAQGYPFANILFEDGNRAVLIQQERRIGEVALTYDDQEGIDRLIADLMAYERPEVKSFQAALRQFEDELPHLLDVLREQIETAATSNAAFQRKRLDFLRLIQQAIDPGLGFADVREMLIQHILTDQLFTAVIDTVDDFHRENTVARALDELVRNFFTGGFRQDTLYEIRPYYAEIAREACSIGDHREKQAFLKVLYETFYKAYNPKAADRLGVVYTPSEIVRFMLASTDHLLEKHFGKLMFDRDVHILDPATGTGTFITELLDYWPAEASTLEQFKYKYLNELHANEVALLPYYIATLNIEYTYRQKTQRYEPFPHSVFVDTLENTGFGFTGKQTDLDFGAFEENQQRIREQNQRRISVIIGNPPYNATQTSENDNNPNKKYPLIDQRIKDTYVKYGTAQNKINLYDMFVRFVRWATDRLGEEGIVAFVSNSTFITTKTFDGFRKVLSEEFSDAYIINLKGDARTSGERRRKEAGNIFENKIRVGIAVYFLVKKPSKKLAIHYVECDDYLSFLQKKDFVRDIQVTNLKTIKLVDDGEPWNEFEETDWEDLLPIVNPDQRSAPDAEALFSLYTSGLKTNRDEWVYDVNREALAERMRFFLDVYNETADKLKGKYKDYREAGDELDYRIKWSRELTKDALRGRLFDFSDVNIINSEARPFVSRYLYFEKSVNEMRYQWPSIPLMENKIIAFTGEASQKPFLSLITATIPDLHFVGAAAQAQCLPRYRYDAEGQRQDNLTDWGLQQFRAAYPDEALTKDDLFAYTYAVLHHPAYRTQYAQNLKRDFPRLPFYQNIRQWINWGNALLQLHLHYETAPHLLGVTVRHLDWDKPTAPKPKLKSYPEAGRIVLDEQTWLEGLPQSVWHYRLGNRSAVDWVLDQYKEKKIKDPTIREKFNTYRFADYKAHVTDLLQKVAHVSVETLRILEAMPPTTEARV